MSGFRLALLQTDPAQADVAANIAAMREAAAPLDADLFLFPELATSGYAFAERSALEGCAAYEDGRGLEDLQTLAEEKDAALVCGLPLREGKAIYNASVLLRPGEAPVFYRKLHLFNREKDVFTPGDRLPEVWSWRGVKLGMMVCFDWIYPETARLLTLAGAELILHPSNLVLSLCQKAMSTRSIENGVFTATCNRVGAERYPDGEELAFTGQSQVTDPSGQILLSLPAQGEQAAILEIDVSLARSKELTARNHLLRDYRADIYGLDGLPAPTLDQASDLMPGSDSSPGSAHDMAPEAAPDVAPDPVAEADADDAPRRKS